MTIKAAYVLYDEENDLYAGLKPPEENQDSAIGLAAFRDRKQALRWYEFALTNHKNQKPLLLTLSELKDVLNRKRWSKIWLIENGIAESVVL